MRRLSALITSLAVGAGSILLASAPAQAAGAVPARAATVKVVPAAAAVQAPKAYVRVLYPTGMRRGGFATFSYRATRLRRIEADAIVLAAFVPRGTVSKVRFLNKPAHASCGFFNSRAYCLIKHGNANTVSVRFQIWVKYKYAGSYSVDHYARAVGLESGLSVRDYVRQISRKDRINRSRTIISRS
ncbi:hypothetical protein [Sphaerisporangium corydalis]|uniref:Uncharacterized protein n=1 Tax=Sphaerisporangium corydalis TaxID=1441875 RepID=A0ABV9EPN7_9ACTN|nr:hypothetical protein [Sphaerisporangium corydalis]